MSWLVYRNGRHIGIVETNYAFASRYWAERARRTGARFTLVPVVTL
jgi:hypothetical protein